MSGVDDMKMPEITKNCCNYEGKYSSNPSLVVAAKAEIKKMTETLRHFSLY
jgi:hypothetical protein